MGENKSQFEWDEEIEEYFKEESNPNDLSLECQVFNKIIGNLQVTGAQMYVVLEKPGQCFKVLTNGISNGAMMNVIMDVFLKYPQIYEQITKDYELLKEKESEGETVH